MSVKENIRKLMVEARKPAQLDEKADLRYAGEEEKIPFETEITLKVTGTIVKRKYIDRGTDEVSDAKEYDVRYDEDAIREQITTQMTPVVKDAVGENVILGMGGCALIGFIRSFVNDEMEEHNKTMRGR